MGALHDLVEHYLAPVDMILHAGDLVAPALMQAFGHRPVHAVRGNMDPAMPGIPSKKVIRVNDFAIGLIHGWGPPDGLEERVLQEFKDVPLDCLVYGHSHRPICTRRDGILFLNPGSATDRRSMAYHTVGLLEIGETLEGSILRID
jgi:putative phosphoesterase